MSRTEERQKRRNDDEDLVTGATGNVGEELVRLLVERGADVRALARKPEEAKFAAGVQVVSGDQTDPESIRAAIKGVDNLLPSERRWPQIAEVTTLWSPETLWDEPATDRLGKVVFAIRS